MNNNIYKIFEEFIIKLHPALKEYNELSKKLYKETSDEEESDEEESDEEEKSDEGESDEEKKSDEEKSDEEESDEEESDEEESDEEESDEEESDEEESDEEESDEEESDEEESEEEEQKLICNICNKYIANKEYIISSKKEIIHTNCIVNKSVNDNDYLDKLLDDSLNEIFL